MKFAFEGKTYVIEFQRRKKQYTRYDFETGLDVPYESTHPYTTATVFVVNPEHPRDKTLFRTATVGCWHGDNFSLEKGRTKTLRLITKTISKEMKPVLWKAYHDRWPRPEPKELSSLPVLLPTSVKD